MNRDQFILDLQRKITVDIFAGGGGWSTAYEQATGQHVHIAINHNPDALSMHEANHPQARHMISDVWEVDPRKAVRGQPVGWLHLSPDCTDHSQAKGGQPRNRKIRALAWVGVYWAGTVQPDIISLENVVQILKWGPLIAKRCAVTRRVVTLEMVTDPATGKRINRVAEPGERVPVENQYLIPCPKRAGRHWKRLVQIWRGMGYTVEWRALNAKDYGAGTKRVRLFAMAKRNGEPIVWPQPTHFAKPQHNQQREMVAADGIDFSIQGNSIFNRKKPLADATMRRIALGMQRYVLNCADPFIVPSTNAAPVLVQAGHGDGQPGARRWSYGCNDVQQPVGTITASNGGHYVATAFMAQANGGYNTTPARDLGQPASTITNTGSQQQLVTAHLVTNTSGHAGGPEDETGALQVAAFLMRYYGQGGQWGDLREPCATITTKDRLALVTVHIRGTPYVIVDIRLRMLTPRELYRLQGFPEHYVIDRGHDGRVFSKSAQVHMCGNSVPPPPAVALIKANAPAELLLRMAA